MIGDDLAGLFPRDTPSEFGFRQGVVLTYHVVSGANTIDVGGTVLTDVPFLNPGGYTILVAGDVVVLMRMRSSWAILGRVTIPLPGGTRAIGRYTELTGVYTGTTGSGFALTTSFVTASNLDISVPLWAEVATITTTLMVFALNNTAVDSYLYGQIDIVGDITYWPSATVLPSKYGQVTVARHTQVAVVGGGTLSLLGQVRANTAWAANASNTATIQATVAWNSNDG